MIDVIVFFIVLVLGFGVQKHFSSRLDNVDAKHLKHLWVFHMFFGIVYWAYIVYGPGGDSLGYYKASNQLSFDQTLSLFFINGPGTYGMYLLNVIPAKIIGFFGFTMIYALFGYLGFIYFYITFIQNIRINTRFQGCNLFPLVLFLPNLHFWSSGLSKDTILFFCIGLFFFAVQNFRRRFLLIVLALALSYLIRPHITIFLVASFGLAYLLDGNLKFFQKAFLFLIFLGLFVILFDNVMAFLKIESLDTEALDQFADTRASNLSRSSTGSAVDISGYPLPLKIFTFLYRPLFFDINNILAVVASFENLILFILSWKLLKVNPIKVFRKGNYLVKSMFLFLIMGSISFSLILGNLGIMLRQKNMFIPCLLFICLYGLSYQQEEKLAKAQKHLTA